MRAAIPTLLVALLAAPIASAAGARQRVEQVRLSRGALPHATSLAVTVDALAQRVTLIGGARLAPLVSTLCPHREDRGADAVLTCTSRRLSASLEGGALRIAELPAPPARDGDASLP